MAEWRQFGGIDRATEGERERGGLAKQNCGLENGIKMQQSYNADDVLGCSVSADELTNLSLSDACTSSGSKKIGVESQVPSFSANISDILKTITE